jgi:pimeloyl-ACP methyl ester carboxylesterase
MPIAKVRGNNINYEVHGSHGPWVALSPGGRRALDGVRPLAQHMAGNGYRVVIHDRRNCGLSDIAIGSEASEYEIWADDLYELMSQVAALPAVVGGGSSGCRLSILFALKYPRAVRALRLWRVTGGAFAAERLTENYYDQYIRAAQDGGMAAVCALDHFKERIEARPANRRTLMAMDPKAFIAAMEHWRDLFRRGAQLPVIGASEQDLNSIRVPTCIIPGNDKTHNHAIAEAAHRMIAGSELHDLFPGDLDVDLVPPEDWAHKEAEMAALFAAFLDRSNVTAGANPMSTHSVTNESRMVELK